MYVREEERGGEEGNLGIFYKEFIMQLLRRKIVTLNNSHFSQGTKCIFIIF